jgi:hypothetical protein
MSVEQSPMEGQWFGTYQGAFVATAILNLDRRKDGYAGTGILLPTDQSLPNVIYAVSLRHRSSDDAELNFVGHADLTGCFSNGAFKPTTADPAALKESFPTVEVDTSRKSLVCNRSVDGLTLIATSDGQRIGEATVQRHSGPRSLTNVAIVERSWDEFKKEIAQQSRTGHLARNIFRGQSEKWAIRTAFHRAHRYDVLRFASEDYNRLRAAISAVIGFPADMTEGERLGAYLGIAQHHGYPTPLLDWTKSPYVAAYFACRDACTSRTCKPTVFLFDRTAWYEDKQRVLFDIGDPRPGLGFLEPMPVRNSRLIPQQSVLMHCNVDALEDFSTAPGLKASGSYMKAFSLSGDPIAILKDLHMMGMNAASLFPGLDGMCRGVFENSLDVIDAIDADSKPLANQELKLPVSVAGAREFPAK